MNNHDIHKNNPAVTGNIKGVVHFDELQETSKKLSETKMLLMEALSVLHRSMDFVSDFNDDYAIDTKDRYDIFMMKYRETLAKEDSI